MKRPNIFNQLMCFETHNGVHMSHGTVNRDKKENGLEEKGCNGMILQSSSERH